VAYRRLVELSPQNPEALYELGLALQGRDRLDEAIATFEQALTLYQQQNNAEGIAKVEAVLEELE